MKTDLMIQQDVMDELSWEPLLRASEIGVAVKSGIVTLSGTVDAYNKKVTAEKAAGRVAGVKAVALDIEVKIGVSNNKNDSEIAAEVVNALKWHTAMQQDKVKVKVENGYVTLEGEVEWDFQRSSAVYMVENLKGVTGISNKIVVKPTVSLADVKKKITAAFHRHANIDSQKVHIETEGSKVILSGTVRSYAEKKDAENAAWLAPGVSKVENQLEIDTEVYTYY